MRHTNRREFLKTSILTGAGVWLGTESAFAAKSPNEKLNVACIGVGGRGASDLKGVSSENIVAICDVDESTLAKVSMQLPMAEKFNDYRKLLDAVANKIDAVVIATPDHCHAAATLAAMQLGKGIYCEKPLTHSIYEARLVRDIARKMKVATQMGNQGHSNDNTRRIVELVQSGMIGPVREVHAWTNRPIWPQGIERPVETPPVPETLNWDAWLGPAPVRPYNPAYHPFKWRGFWDFGTGALGDMACHIMDAAYWSLKLGSPTAVEPLFVEAGPLTETAPKSSILRYEFPQRGDLPPVKLTWYDGKKLPPAELFEGEKVVQNGSLFIGEKGKLYVPDAYGGKHMLLGKEKFADAKVPPQSIPNSIGHHAEWVLACKTGSATGSNFEYATALTEMVLSGNVALRLGKRLEWDGPNMKATNAPEADALIRPAFRPGWGL